MFGEVLVGHVRHAVERVSARLNADAEALVLGRQQLVLFTCLDALSYELLTLDEGRGDLVAAEAREIEHLAEFTLINVYVDQLGRQRVLVVRFNGRRPYLEAAGRSKVFQHQLATRAANSINTGSYSECAEVFVALRILPA